MAVSKASATWNGTLKEGNGGVKGTGFEAPFTFASRFEGSGKGTNPEELIGAAHAGCFSMALSAELQKAGFKADTISTTATVTLENHPQTSWTVSAVHLTTTATVPGIAADKFAEVAAGAKAGCPISRLLKATITLDAKLT